jgi:hypothetical protein
MMELLVSFIQCLCLIAYFYGAWLVIMHKAGLESSPSRAAVLPVQQQVDDELTWQKYLAYDV